MSKPSNQQNWEKIHCNGRKCICNVCRSSGYWGMDSICHNRNCRYYIFNQRFCPGNLAYNMRTSIYNYPSKIQMGDMPMAGYTGDIYHSSNSIYPACHHMESDVKVVDKITESDIKYRDDMVCILKPEVKKGIIIWSHFIQPENGSTGLCTSGLKTGDLLNRECIDFGRIVYHPYVFFRAPYYSRPIDYSSVQKEIISSYGEIQHWPKAYIRVDPDRTYVFSSEIRLRVDPQDYQKTENIIRKSKKTLTEYLEIIHKNLEIEKNILPYQHVWYNLYSSQAVLFPETARPGPVFDQLPINRNSEILVPIPHLTPDYFVMCKEKDIE